MQYLLTPEEHKALTERPAQSDLADARLANLALRTALLDAQNLHCNMSRQEPREGARRVTYCDECPVGKLLHSRTPYLRAICPDADRWSK